MKKYIIVKAKIRGKIINNKFVFGNEQIISLGKTVNIATDNFNFTDYVVSNIE